MKPHASSPAFRRSSLGAGAGLLLLVCACSTVTLPLGRAPAPVADEAADTMTREESEPFAAGFIGARAVPALRAPARRAPSAAKVRPTIPLDPFATGDTQADPALQALLGSGPDEASADESPVAGPVPKLEPLAKHANRPYRLRGRQYRPLTRLQPFKQRGIASWYGKPFHGRRTASGERYDMHSMSAAHPTLPLPSYVKVTNLKSGTSIIVRVNDRGPFAHGRVIDLSHASARHLGMLEDGIAAVELNLVMPEATATETPVPLAGIGHQAAGEAGRSRSPLPYD